MHLLRQKRAKNSVTLHKASNYANQNYVSELCVFVITFAIKTLKKGHSGRRFSEMFGFY